MDCNLHHARMSRISSQEYETVPPEPAALVESLRAFGYDLSTALADLADNSLFHQSRHITVHFHWAGENSAIAVADDGDGTRAEKKFTTSTGNFENDF